HDPVNPAIAAAHAEPGLAAGLHARHWSGRDRRACGGSAAHGARRGTGCIHRSASRSDGGYPHVAEGGTVPALGRWRYRRRAAQDVGMGAACEADAMMLIWRSILLMAVVWLMAPLSAQASPPLALETTIPLQRVVIF